MKLAKRKVLIPAAILFSAAIVLAILELTNTTHLFHNSPAPVTASSATKGVPLAERPAPQPNEDQKASDGKSKDNENNSDDPDFVLLAPIGTFVSNHHPNLDGDPAPNQIQSVCTTSVGARCTIQFTKGQVTKSLPPQTTDSGGSTYWTWKLQDIGLTEGTWHITAKATYGNQVKTTSDSLELEVAE